MRVDVVSESAKQTCLTYLVRCSLFVLASLLMLTQISIGTYVLFVVLSVVTGGFIWTLDRVQL